jgi:uncharacterized protein
MFGKQMRMNKNSRIIIFVKNAEPGKVKTRLAKSVGNHAALSVYHKLLEITECEVHPVKAEKVVAYSGYIAEGDYFPAERYRKVIQQGDNLGERMQNAFEHSFRDGSQKVLLIGSDCPELKTKHLSEAFDKLDQSDVVLGPARDGGYYLIGLKKCYAELFRGIKWSTQQVLKQTMDKIRSLNLTCELLEELADIDTLEDLRKSHLKL